MNIVRNQVGSIYLELLLAFFIWLIILSTVIPSLLHSIINRKEVMIDHMGNQIVSRQFQKVVYNQPVDPEITVDNYSTYYTVVNESTEGMKEICVHYETQKGKKKKCRVLTKN
ncbi:hypothetical protein [Bacillus andreraoultii]|uniref:hypothetical protein n=1 Tax=Bacillus andreraoultii TaxID=1499685 RepID=UPI001651CA70|nr:hypothetical protein [Bacillus andreraoultii]